MATNYGSYVNNYWRTYLTTSVSSTTNTQSKVSYTVGVNHKAIPSSVANTWNKKHDYGNVTFNAATELSWSEGNITGTEPISSAGSFSLKDSTKTYTRTCTAQSVTVKGKNSHSSAGNAPKLVGTSTASATVTIPARPKYTITFDMNGGSGGDVSLKCSHCDGNHKSYGYNSSVVTTTAPKRTGYEFKGWYTATSGGTRVTTVTANAATTLHAQWTPHHYYVQYLANAPDAMGTMPITSCTYGTAFYLERNRFIRPGYRFVGWEMYGTPSHKFVDHAFVSNLTPVDLKTCVLLAVWEPCIPNTYVKNNRWFKVNKVCIKVNSNWVYAKGLYIKQNGSWFKLE